MSFSMLKKQKHSDERNGRDFQNVWTAKCGMVKKIRRHCA